MSQIQSVVFFIDKGWTSAKAKKWLKVNEIEPMKRVDKSLENQLRYRIEDPSQFKRFITKKQKNGVNLIIGFPM